MVSNTCCRLGEGEGVIYGLPVSLDLPLLLPLRYSLTFIYNKIMEKKRNSNIIHMMMHDLYLDKTFQCDGNVLTAVNNF